MKAKWEGERPRKARVFGLYKRIGFMRFRLLCMFLDRENGIETVRHMGKGYSLKSCRMP